MKKLKLIAGIILTVALVALAPSSRADGTNTAPPPPKPDLLKTCPVSGEKLGGDMGEPFKFVYQGQEVKLCCSMCKAKFDKDPAKYIKKIQAATIAAEKGK
jgi:YHS domain-containing protein